MHTRRPRRRPIELPKQALAQSLHVTLASIPGMQARLARGVPHAYMAPAFLCVPPFVSGGKTLCNSGTSSSGSPRPPSRSSSLSSSSDRAIGTSPIARRPSGSLPHAHMHFLNCKGKVGHGYSASYNRKLPTYTEVWKPKSQGIVWDLFDNAHGLVLGGTRWDDNHHHSTTKHVMSVPKDTPTTPESS